MVNIQPFKNNDYKKMFATIGGNVYIKSTYEKTGYEKSKLPRW